MNEPDWSLYRLLTNEDLVIGLDVICVYRGRSYGRCGKITKITKDSYGRVLHFDVSNMWAGSYWTMITSFMTPILSKESDIDILPISELKDSINIDSSTKYINNDPCPLKYYGIGICKCGTCKPLYKIVNNVKII